MKDFIDPPPSQNMNCCLDSRIKQEPRLTERVDVIDFVKEPADSFGYVASSEKVYLSLYAEVIGLSQGQQLQADQQTGVARYRIIFRYSNKGMKIRHDMKLRYIRRGLPSIDLDLDGPPIDLESERKFIRLFANQRQKGTE